MTITDKQKKQLIIFLGLCLLVYVIYKLNNKSSFGGKGRSKFGADRGLMGGGMPVNPNQTYIFFSPNCGHCVKAKPQFENAANMDSNIKLIDVTKPDGSALSDKFNVSSVPTIVKGDGTKFNGDRNADTIVNFAKS